MFKILFLLPFVASVRIRTSCDVSYYDHNSLGKVYTCSLKNIQIDKPATRIVSIKLNHIENHENDDVRVVKIDREKTAYLPQGLNSFFVNMDEYYVMRSRLQYIFRTDFKGIEKLKSLSFYSNQIEVIPRNTFYDLTELKMLSLNDNKIKEIPLTLLQNLLNLEYLSFRTNLITHVSSYIFKNCKQLQTISLINNRIQTISADFILTNLPNLLELSLGNNKCIDENYTFGPNDLKNITIEQINELCSQKSCQQDNDVIVEYRSLLESCEKNVQNLWEEKKMLGAF